MNRHDTIKEQLVKIFYNGNRKLSNNGYIRLEQEIVNILEYIRDLIHSPTTTLPSDALDIDNIEYGFYIQMICRIVLYTRDILRGKGERDVSYCMLYAVYLVYPEIARELLYRFVLNENRQGVGVGSWLDMKKMSEYVFSVKGESMEHPIIRDCIFLTNTQLYIDNFVSHKHLGVSDVASCIPREKSTNAWFFQELANDWSRKHTPYYFKHATTDEQLQSAIRKSKMQYRKIVSNLSHLPPCLPSPENVEKNSTKTAKDNVRTLYEFVSEAVRLLRVERKSNMEDVDSSSNANKINKLNADWKAMIQTHENNPIGNVLPILDISCSMKDHGEMPLYGAIGVACFLLEKTTLEKRIITIDQTPTWIIMPEILPPFVSMVKEIMEVADLHGGTNKNVFRTIDLLANSFASCRGIKCNISLVIISDMKFTHFRDLPLSDNCLIDDYISSWILSAQPENRCVSRFAGEATEGRLVGKSKFDGEATEERLVGQCPHIAYWNVGLDDLPCRFDSPSLHESPHQYNLPLHGDLPCRYDKYGATVISGAVANCAECILPKWNYNVVGNPSSMIANTPFDAMCTVLMSFSPTIIQHLSERRP